MHEFLQGARLLLRGLGQWRRSPGAMALGLIPGFLVGLVFGAALVAWAVLLGNVVDDWTPFADDWDHLFLVLLMKLTHLPAIGHK